MNDTLKAIVKVLTEGKPERQIAAAQILAELKPPEPLVVKALATRLSSAEPILTRFLLEALAAIGSEDSARALLERLRMGGAESEQIALLMSREENGAGTRFLASVFDESDLELRCRILGIVARHTSREGLSVLRKALLSPEPTLADAGLRAVQDLAPKLSGERRVGLVDQLKKDVEHKDIAAAALAHTLRALGILDPIGVRAVLLKFAGGKHPGVVRQAALVGLVGAELTPAQAEALLAHVGEHDMTYVVRPTIAVLAKNEKWPSTAVAKLKKLLEGGSEEQQRFALQALRHCKTEAVASACLQFLLDPHDALHEVAAEALADNPAAVEVVLAAFVKEKDVAVARRLASPLVRLGAHCTPAQVENLVERAAKQVANGEPMGDVTLHVVLHGARDKALEELAERAHKLRKAKKSPEAHHLLVRVATHAPLSNEAQYQLALCKLLAEESARGGENHGTAAGNATMGYFASLVRDGFPVAERLKKEALLLPEHLLRIGSHFAEAVGTERRFGADLLQHVANKHARGKAGEQAKFVLRAENL